MKISTKGTSRFLSQSDIAAPFTAIIQDVRVENLKSNSGEENKCILYFTTGKPMVFNVNRKTVVAAYGDDSAAWIGTPVEVYVDPNVHMGSERTGGIRLRIPEWRDAEVQDMPLLVRISAPQPINNEIDDQEAQ